MKINPITRTLYDYRTGEPVRTATTDEYEASLAAATRDGGAGVITTADCPSAYVV